MLPSMITPTDIVTWLDEGVVPHHSLKVLIRLCDSNQKNSCRINLQAVHRVWFDDINRSFDLLFTLLVTFMTLVSRLLFFFILLKWHEIHLKLFHRIRQRLLQSLCSELQKAAIWFSFIIFFVYFDDLLQRRGEIRAVSIYDLVAISFIRYLHKPPLQIEQHIKNLLSGAEHKIKVYM